MEVVVDLRQEPFDPVRLGFVDPYLGLQYFIKQAAISAYRHALGLIGNRFSDPDAQALREFVGSPECPLPWVFVLACVPIATSA